MMGGRGASGHTGLKAAKPSKEKDYISLVLQHCGEKVVKEFVFSSERKFRSDWALPDLKILIEYEGLVFTGNRNHKTTGKSGHTTIAGYNSNCEKYSLASVEGWIVLRFTAMNYKNISLFLDKAIKLRKREV